MHKIKRNLELVINPNETELIKINADINIINFSSIFSANTPSDLSLLLTLPLVILGMRRFKKDSLNSSYGDQPEEIIFKSKFIILIFFSWIIISSLIIYVRN